MHTYKYRGTNVLMYTVTTSVPSFECQTLSLSCAPLAAAFTPDGNLLVLTENLSHLIQFFIKDESHQYTPNESDLTKNLLTNHLAVVQGIKKMWIHIYLDILLMSVHLLPDCVRSCNGDLKPLFKRWFDNVQAYRERKGERNGKSLPLVDPSDSKRPRVESE